MQFLHVINAIPSRSGTVIAARPSPSHLCVCQSAKFSFLSQLPCSGTFLLVFGPLLLGVVTVLCNTPHRKIMNFCRGGTFRVTCITKAIIRSFVVPYNCFIHNHTRYLIFQPTLPSATVAIFGTCLQPICPLFAPAFPICLSWSRISGPSLMCCTVYIIPANFRSLIGHVRSCRA